MTALADTPVPVPAGSDFDLAAAETHRKLGRKSYDQQLAARQQDLRRLQLAYLRHQARGIVVFEGWDAAGKGGIIRRMAAMLEPRACAFWSIGPPEPAWQGRHYLARFWPLLPEPGRISVFDRSWYGRVLVERVEGLTSKAAWQRAYGEINAFEQMLTDDGVRIVKIFLHISEAEQLRRFQARIDDPLKRWKIGLSDVRNHELRKPYAAAIETMIRQTSSEHAPWIVIPADDKHYARVVAMQAIVRGLTDGLPMEVPELSRDVARAAREHLGLEVPEHIE